MNGYYSVSISLFYGEVKDMNIYEVKNLVLL